jgi:SPP1 family predicted phage head-tail adaptor
MFHRAESSILLVDELSVQDDQITIQKKKKKKSKQRGRGTNTQTFYKKVAKSSHPETEQTARQASANQQSSNVFGSGTSQ